MALGNSIQSYLTLTYSSQVYLGPAPPPSSSKTHPRTNPLNPAFPYSPATPLSSRTFGTWTLVQSIVRLYAAYNLSNPRFYELAFITYAVAWFHFMVEWFGYGTVRWGRGVAGPVIVSTGSLIWMWMVWGSYTQ
jgi:hypothetical protein